jgi:antitoxin HigA-1
VAAIERKATRILASIDLGHPMTATLDHPGLVLARELEALGVSPTELARQLRVPPNRITQIINGKRAITGDSALRLAHWFRNSPEFWMNLQVQHDLRMAAMEAQRQIKNLPTRTHLHTNGVVTLKVKPEGKTQHGRS